MKEFVNHDTSWRVYREAGSNAKDGAYLVGHKAFILAAMLVGEVQRVTRKLDATTAASLA